MSLRVRIVRKLASLQYLREPSAAFDWHNNDANNSLDALELFDDDESLLVSKVQTVANLEGLDPGVHFYDTIAPGKFFLRAFVDPREFKCQPLGIVGAVTKRGEPILEDSTTVTNKSRWLEHDRKDHQGNDTRVAWSAGCIVHWNDDDLVQLNAIYKDRGVQPGDLIPAELFEEGDS